MGVGDEGQERTTVSLCRLTRPKGFVGMHRLISPLEQVILPPKRTMNDNLGTTVVVRTGSNATASSVREPVMLLNTHSAQDGPPQRVT